MNIIALLVGLVLGAFIIARCRQPRHGSTQWDYPALLASFPFYYIAFALYAGDQQALVGEAVIGLVFIAVAYGAYRLESRTGVVLLAIGYLGHALYDVVHTHVVVNEGTPDWWPEFCGAVDGLVGGYLVYLVVARRGLTEANDGTGHSR